MYQPAKTPAEPLKVRLQPFLDYLAATPVNALLNDYTFCLLTVGSDEAEHNERLYQLQQRVKKLVSDTDFDVWLADCARRNREDPDLFFDNAAAQRDKTSRRDRYAARALTGVQSAGIRWLVPGLVPRGEITVIGADGGTGKGLYSAQMIAAVTTGAPSEFFPQAVEQPGNVLIFSGEDDPASVLRPRLLAAGADLERVFFVTADGYYADTGALLDIHEEPLLQIIRRTAPALVVIDPLQQFLSGRVNMANRNEMRATVTPIRALARQLGFATVFVLHTNKKMQVAGRARLADSSDLWDMARSVVMLGSSRNDGKVYASHEKSSYAAPVPTVLFTRQSATVEGVRTGRAVFDSLTDKHDADFVSEPRLRIAQTKADTAAAIRNILAESRTASMASSDLRAAVVQEIGCSDRTYNRAYGELVKSGEVIKCTIRQKDGTNKWHSFLYCGETNGKVQ